MSLIEAGCELQYQVTTPTTFLFNIAVADTSFQTIESEQCRINPGTDSDFMHVGEMGNRILRLKFNPGEFTITYDARVNLEPQLNNPSHIGELDFHSLPAGVLPFLNPSRYCESDRLSRLAIREFGQQAPGHQRVQAICDWTNMRLQYLSGTTNASSSACDVLVQGAGVCRDYAHLAIALCRAICIPARYVAGYAVGLKPQDFHGFFEAYLDGGWYLFDATGMAPRDGLVRIGTGRDAADVSFSTITGTAVLLKMAVYARDVTGVIDSDNATEKAVSTSG
jgi:transglutaminase-like putative cysteine protease